MYLPLVKWPTFLAISPRPWFLAFSALFLISSLPPSLNSTWDHSTSCSWLALCLICHGKFQGGFRASEMRCLHLGQQTQCVKEAPSGALWYCYKAVPGLSGTLPGDWDHVPNMSQHLKPHTVPWAHQTSLNVWCRCWGWGKNTLLLPGKLSNSCVRCQIAQHTDSIA